MNCIIFKTPLFWLKYLSKDLIFSRNFLNSTLESVTLPALLIVVFTETRVSALTTNAEDVLFERTLIDGFSCVNIRLAFDSQILLLKNGPDRYKLIYTTEGQKTRILTKILKMNQNN